MTRVAVPALTLLLAIAVVAGASAGPRAPRLGRLAADGPVQLASSRPGVALLKASNMKPGDRVSGVIALTNTGDEPGALALMPEGVRDRPGAYGGRLSSVLQLRVQDLTSGRTWPAMTLARAVPVALGPLRGHETRRYRVTALFPDTGLPPTPVSGDNAEQGSSADVGLRWLLTVDTPGPATPTAPPAALPAAPAPVSGQAVLLRLRIPPQRVIRPRGLKAYAACEVACKVRFAARLDSAPRHGGRRRTLMRRHVLRGERRWRTLRAGREQRVFLKLRPRALKRLKRRLHRHGRVGITVTARMRSTAGDGTARRRIVIRP